MKKTVYIESSALLRVLLEGDALLAQEISQAAIWVTSELTLLETERAFLRAVHEKRITSDGQLMMRHQLEHFASSTEIITLETEILKRAKQAFPVEPVRTLDAIHLASILLWDREANTPVVASCDVRIRSNVSRFGLPLIPDSL